MGSERANGPGCLNNLVTIYIARRELVSVLRRELLNNEREAKLEEADTLLSFLRSKTGESGAISLDEKGYTGLRQIEATQMLSQSQIHRRVSALLKNNYLQEQLPRRGTAAIKVRLTEKGEKFADRYWKDYRKLASLILEPTDASERQAHLRVNDSIQRKIHGLSLPFLTPPRKDEPAENLVSLFATATAIRLAIERAVILPEDGKSVERVDLLVLLYTKGNNFTPFGTIQQNLVHSFSPSRHLISRWIGEMTTQGFVATEGPAAGKRMAAALTQKGREKVRPILDRYNRLAQNLMAGISEKDREAHIRINWTISDSIRPRLKHLTSSAV